MRVVSFAGDGDSRVMRITLPLSTTDSLLSMNINKTLKCTEMPAILNKWTCMRTIPEVFCVQDIVHIGVKLKARLLKPSIILPLGKYIATSSHL